MDLTPAADVSSSASADSLSTSTSTSTPSSSFLLSSSSSSTSAPSTKGGSSPEELGELSVYKMQLRGAAASTSTPPAAVEGSDKAKSSTNSNVNVNVAMSSGGSGSDETPLLKPRRGRKPRRIVQDGDVISTSTQEVDNVENEDESQSQAQAVKLHTRSGSRRGRGRKRKLSQHSARDTDSASSTTPISDVSVNVNGDGDTPGVGTGTGAGVLCELNNYKSGLNLSGDASEDESSSITSRTRSRSATRMMTTSLQAETETKRSMAIGQDVVVQPLEVSIAMTNITFICNPDESDLESATNRNRNPHSFTGLESDVRVDAAGDKNENKSKEARKVSQGQRGEDGDAGTPAPKRPRIQAHHPENIEGSTFISASASTPSSKKRGRGRGKAKNAESAASAGSEQNPTSSTTIGRYWKNRTRSSGTEVDNISLPKRTRRPKLKLQATVPASAPTLAAPTPTSSVAAEASAPAAPTLTPSVASTSKDAEAVKAIVNAETDEFWETNGTPDGADGYGDFFCMSFLVNDVFLSESSLTFDPSPVSLFRVRQIQATPEPEPQRESAVSPSVSALPQSQSAISDFDRIFIDQNQTQTATGTALEIQMDDETYAKFEEFFSTASPDLETFLANFTPTDSSGPGPFVDIEVEVDVDTTNKLADELPLLQNQLLPVAAPGNAAVTVNSASATVSVPTPAPTTNFVQQQRAFSADLLPVGPPVAVVPVPYSPPGQEPIYRFLDVLDVSLDMNDLPTLDDLDDVCEHNMDYLTKVFASNPLDLELAAQAPTPTKPETPSREAEDVELEQVFECQFCYKQFEDFNSCVQHVDYDPTCNRKRLRQQGQEEELDEGQGEEEQEDQEQGENNVNVDVNVNIQFNLDGNVDSDSDADVDANAKVTENVTPGPELEPESQRMPYLMLVSPN